MSQPHIIKNPQDVLPYLNKIYEAADSNRNTFGFNTIGAYEDSIKRGNLWVAVSSSGDYWGHIMIGGRPPRYLRIFQIFVIEKAQGKGVASLLLKEVVKYGESLNCLDLRADVASDLTGAVRFWQAKGFCALAPRQKQNKTGREVLIFQKRLSTPSLLDERPANLEITSKAIDCGKPSYVIDLNIFLTLIKDQENVDLISEIIQAALSGEFSLFVTPEFQKELQRNKRDSVDPLLDFAEKSLPTLGEVSEKELSDIKGEIKEIVFPQRTTSRKYAENDESDLRHLAYCVLNGRYGFLTQESAILKVKEKMFERFGLEICSPHDFKVDYLGANLNAGFLDVPFSREQGDIQISNEESVAGLRKFMSQIDEEFSKLSNVIFNNSSRGFFDRKIVTDGGAPRAIYIARTTGVKHSFLEGFFLSNVEQFEGREAVFQHMLECFMRYSQTVKATKIALYIRKEDFDFDNICLRRGFQRAESDIDGLALLVKVSTPPLVTKANWSAFQANFLANTQVQLPNIIPKIMKNAEGLPIVKASLAGRAQEIELHKLETFTSPSLFLLPERTGVILPITPAYAESLLVRSHDMLPFPLSQEALLRTEKVYYRNPKRHSKMFKTGEPIMFYESGSGRGVVGCARITSVRVVNYKDALKIYGSFGVLNEKELLSYSDSDENIQVIVFDNFKEFLSPVSFKRLQELGCAKASLVAPEKLPYKAMYSILHEGTSMPQKDVLLSIQPSYVSKILNGKKTVELRKKPFPLLGREGSRVWIYSTSPTSAVEASAFVQVVEEDTPENIWKKYKNKCGISKIDFDAYFKGYSTAYALHIEDVRKLKKRVKLNELKELSKGFVPPQYFRYVNHESELFDELTSL